MSPPHRVFGGNEPSSALDGVNGLRIKWAARFFNPPLLLRMLREVKSSAKDNVRRRRAVAARAAPNDPCHITTHDASLPPGETGADPLRQTNGPSTQEIFVEGNSWRAARPSDPHHRQHKSGRAMGWEQKHTVASFTAKSQSSLSHVTEKHPVEGNSRNGERFQQTQKSQVLQTPPPHMERIMTCGIRDRCRWIFQMWLCSPCGYKSQAWQYTLTLHIR